MLTRIRLSGFPALLVVIGALLTASPVTGEVSVNTDPEGTYQSTSVLISEVPNGFLFWAPVRDIEPGRCLNPDGDLFHDGRPAVIDDRRSGSPVVVWARSTGRSRVLVWSTWERNGWNPPRWLHTLPGAEGDFDPVLTADPAGRIHLVWWREEAGRGRIYWSRFLGAAGWTPPRPISPSGADARYPAFDPESQWPAVVWFDRGGRRGGAARLPSTPGIVTTSGTSEKAQSGTSDGLTDDPDVMP